MNQIQYATWIVQTGGATLSAPEGVDDFVKRNGVSLIRTSNSKVIWVRHNQYGHIACDHTYTQFSASSVRRLSRILGYDYLDLNVMLSSASPGYRIVGDNPFPVWLTVDANVRGRMPHVTWNINILHEPNATDVHRCSIGDQTLLSWPHIGDRWTLTLPEWREIVLEIRNTEFTGEDGGHPHLIVDASVVNQKPYSVTHVSIGRGADDWSILNVDKINTSVRPGYYTVYVDRSYFPYAGETYSEDSSRIQFHHYDFVSASSIQRLQRTLQSLAERTGQEL